jgi:hypothetical protein
LSAPRTIAVVLLVACAGCARSEEQWRASLADADPFTRGMSALALARVAPEQCAEAIPRLLELVDGPDEALAAAARRELARVARHHVPQLLANYTEVEDASLDFRSALRAALVAAGPDAVGPLRAQLLAGGVSNPRQLGQILADIGASAVAPLVADLADPDARRRVCTAWVLARLGRDAQAAAPALAQLLERDAAPVARQAALALAEVAPLEPATRAALARARAQRGAELDEALARLALNRVRLGVQEDTDAQLFALGLEAFVPAVEACAGKERALREAGERHLRARFAALALGLAPAGLGAQRDLARLQEKLDERDPGTRARAVLDLAALGARAQAFVGPLAAHLGDGHPGVALAARLALLQVLRRIALDGGGRRP